MNKPDYAMQALVEALEMGVAMCRTEDELFELERSVAAGRSGLETVLAAIETKRQALRRPAKEETP